MDEFYPKIIVVICSTPSFTITFVDETYRNYNKWSTDLIITSMIFLARSKPSSPPVL